ncbi:hypothetical protein MHYP_G00033900 [Metynnis hypsauchen]
MQKLIILRAMRPDRMSYALRNFVEESLGSRYVDPGKALGLKLGFSTERGEPPQRVSGTGSGERCSERSGDGSCERTLGHSTECALSGALAGSSGRFTGAHRSGR